ncbi:hypothetical protein [Leucobacter sp. cx-169]|uniref:hypothetical protein n=1 Tax=Leucobacter sp. cx-169 TaxID=2770549 RepID=UPI00165DD7BD|nr:hypothetical protein [Leucobacter sp. cx-169]MBC9927298.1 hypothetical protein [Leucobacter sp. cx-169]
MKSLPDIQVRLTDPQLRALRAIASAGDRGAPGRYIAEQVWPESPAWSRTTRSRPGFSGSKGGTMPMNGARLGYRVKDLGMVSAEHNDIHQTIFHISREGTKYLASVDAEAETSTS